MLRYIFKTIDYVIYALASGIILLLLFSWEELNDMFLQLTTMELRVIAFIAILGRHLDYVYRLLKWVTSKIRNKITGYVLERE
ncbi:hypothetical protein MPCS_01942 (plasmid) [Candidatus Megaera polyxenophila]|nr:hypothetical protein MPCS_01942 [Candidatus Megaera polyxenophila]